MLKNSMNLTWGIAKRFQQMAARVGGDGLAYLRVCDALDGSIDVLRSYVLSTKSKLEHSQSTAHLVST
jgi:hypothetical protein